MSNGGGAFSMAPEVQEKVTDPGVAAPGPADRKGLPLTDPMITAARDLSRVQLPTELEHLRRLNAAEHHDAAGCSVRDDLAAAWDTLTQGQLVSPIRSPRTRSRPSSNPRGTRTGYPVGVSESANNGHPRPECPNRSRYARWFRGEDSGRPYRFGMLTCQRRTCGPCRDFLAARDTRDALTVFDGRPMYRFEVDADAWEVARRRINRRLSRTEEQTGEAGGWVRVPVSGDRFAVFATVPPTTDPTDAHEVPEVQRRAYLRDAMTRRPVGAHTTSNAKRGEQGRSGSALADARPIQERLIYDGHDNSRADAWTVERLAAEDGIPTVRVVETDELEGVRFDVHRYDPRMERLRRRLGWHPARSHDAVEMVYDDENRLIGILSHDGDVLPVVANHPPEQRRLFQVYEDGVAA